MGATTPDGLPWPENGDPSLVPQDMQELATAVQVALDKKPATSANTLQGANGFAPSGTTLYKIGKLVVATGTFARSAGELAVTDNTEYQFASIPAGYRPSAQSRMAGTWKGFDGSKSQISTCQMVVETSGAIKFVANYTGRVRAGDYIAAGGLIWWTP